MGLEWGRGKWRTTGTMCKCPSVLEGSPCPLDAFGREVIYQRMPIIELGSRIGTPVSLMTFPGDGSCVFAPLSLVHIL